MQQKVCQDNMSKGEVMISKFAMRKQASKKPKRKGAY